MIFLAYYLYCYLIFGDWEILLFKFYLKNYICQKCYSEDLFCYSWSQTIYKHLFNFFYFYLIVNFWVTDIFYSAWTHSIDVNE